MSQQPIAWIPICGSCLLAFGFWLLACSESGVPGTGDRGASDDATPPDASDLSDAADTGDAGPGPEPEEDAGFSPIPLGSEIVCTKGSLVPTIDGLIEYAEWKDAAAYETTIGWLDINAAPTGASAPALVLAKNDGNNIYLAVRYADQEWDAEIDENGNVLQIDVASVEFDEDLSGEVEAGEDRKIMAPIWFGAYFDKHGPGDGDGDTRSDGFGRMRYSQYENSFHAEISIPFDSGDPDDLLIAPGASIGVRPMLIDRFDFAGASPSVRGLGYLFAQSPGFIGTLKTAPASPTPPPALPKFTGRMAIISRHDFVPGDIFLYDFDAEELSRVTDGHTNPEHAFFKDNVSISPDGRWIAFHGSPDSEDWAHYEIFKIKADGTSLTKLTDNVLLDGHPAFSPDGTRIAYVTFLRLEGGDVFIMDAQTGAVLRRLTNSGGDENDPDWSPDGKKIVFKSKRWTGKEQIAVMDADGDAAQWPGGKNVVRLTDNAFSDHDGVLTSDGNWVLFERYVGSGEWTESVGISGWEPKDERWLRVNWEVYAVRIDGKQEKKIIETPPAMGAQWLPVGERSTDAAGVVLIRSYGVDYNVIVRTTLDGATDARLVPELTNVGYIDWK
jgi:hypothetical protein